MQQERRLMWRSREQGVVGRKLTVCNPRRKYIRTRVADAVKSECSLYPERTGLAGVAPMIGSKGACIYGRLPLCCQRRKEDRLGREVVGR